MNSYIFTSDGGVSAFIGGRLYSCSAHHENIDKITEALKEKAFDRIPRLMDSKIAIQEYISPHGLVSTADTIYYNGIKLDNVVTQHISKMIRDGFDIDPMLKYLENLLENPSEFAINELFLWQQRSGMPITEDGHFLALKKVRSDFGSFYDSGATKNIPGTFIEMPREHVRADRNITCSYGFHFCSYDYLDAYFGGKGTVLLLKINPRDVVSIPSDHNNAKGRACKYEILHEIVDIDVHSQSEWRDYELVNTSVYGVESNNVPKGDMAIALQFYEIGYWAGRNKIEDELVKRCIQQEYHHRDGAIKKDMMSFWDFIYLTNEYYYKGYEAGKKRIARHYKKVSLNPILQLIKDNITEQELITSDLKTLKKVIGLEKAKIKETKTKKTRQDKFKMQIEEAYEIGHMIGRGKSHWKLEDVRKRAKANVSNFQEIDLKLDMGFIDGKARRARAIKRVNVDHLFVKLLK